MVAHVTVTVPLPGVADVLAHQAAIEEVTTDVAFIFSAVSMAVHVRAGEKVLARLEGKRVAALDARLPAKTTSNALPDGVKDAVANVEDVVEPVAVIATVGVAIAITYLYSYLAQCLPESCTYGFFF